MRSRSIRHRVLLLIVALLAASGARAQTVVRANERLDDDRPEAWAMNYFTASSLMTGFGAVPELAPGAWALASELGHIPRLDEEQQRVGFAGFKDEDLNKSPVFGRVRGMVGLPGGWVAELGYTPPVEIDGTRARDLVAAAIGRRLLARGSVSLSARLFGQHGAVRGDVTCPSELAGVEDFTVNPFGCRAPSEDTLRLDHYGIELTAALECGDWSLHLGAAVVRTETQVQVDAYTYDVRDRSRLTARDVLPAVAAGAARRIAPRWRWGVELLYVPLQVRREAGAPADNDPLASLRVFLRYEPERQTAR